MGGTQSLHTNSFDEAIGLVAVPWETGAVLEDLDGRRVAEELLEEAQDARGSVLALVTVELLVVDTFDVGG